MFPASCSFLVVLIAVSVALGQQSTAPLISIESLIRSQEYDRALQITRSRLRETPKDFRFWTLEGIIFSIKGSNPAALIAFNKALSLSPNYAPALKGEVQILYQGGDKRAIPLLEKILKLDSSDQTGQEMLAMLEKKEGDCTSAIDHFLLSAEVIGTHPESLEAYAYCLVNTKQYKRAIPVFAEIAALRPGRTYPKYDLAVVLVATGQYDAALKVLNPLLAKDQSDPEMLSLASEAYEAVGDTPKAVTLLRQAIVLSPTNASYYASFAALCFNHDSFQVGVDILNAGLQRISDDPTLYISRGLLYVQLAQYDKAEADFKRAEQLNSKQSLSSYALVLTEMQRNDPEGALLKVRSQLKIHPDSPMLHYLFAELIMNQGPSPDSEIFKEAIRSALLTVKLKPGLVRARDLLASMYIRSDQYSLAVKQSRIALQHDLSDKSAVYHLMIALRHSGHNEEVRALAKRLSEMQQTSLQQDTDRKRYMLVEQKPVPPDQER